MIEPLIRRSDEQEARRVKQYSTIKTTPESIVKIYRLQRARREPVERSYIFTPKRPRIPWHQKINWDVVSSIGGLFCGLAVIAVIFYLIVWHIRPFVEALRWG